jgi:hypothetical protein
MSQDSPSPPSTNAPPAAITNIKVAFALLAPPSPSSPTFHRRAGVANLFHDCIETDANKRLSNLSSTGYPPTLRRRGGVERAVLGREGVNCMAISLLLEIHAKRATLMTVLIQTKKRMRTNYPLRRTSSSEPLRSQSPGIQRLPSTIVTLHSFVP